MMLTSQRSFAGRVGVRASPVLQRTALVAVPVHRRPVTSRPATADAPAAVAAPAQAITLTDRARLHLSKLQVEQSAAAGPGSAATALLLRVGVRQGGCSGMSYQMDFTKDGDVKPEDMIMDHGDNLKLVVDPKSLLYLFGMNLDYSDALIGGGFQFHNPNAAESCGCGKSFGV